MPLSVQGNAVLTKMWNHFHSTYVEKNPGCNTNDVERAFLYQILAQLAYNSDAFAPYSETTRETEELIEKIR